MNIQKKIIDHYSKEQTVDKDNAHLHTGAHIATAYFLEKLNLKPDMQVLDVGCGVGGPAIMAAQDYGCHVTGIDLTPSFIENAKTLAAQEGVSDKTEFQIASTDGIEFSDEHFDLIMMMHVGMNVPNKLELYQDCARTLKTGSTLAVYDLLAMDNPQDLTYPLPWSPTAETSFVEPLSKMEEYFTACGLRIETIENRQAFAIDIITKMIEKKGDTLNDFRKVVVQNLLDNLTANRLAPHIITARKI